MGKFITIGERIHCISPVIREAMANREVYLATVKQRQEEYQASRKNAAPVASTAKSGYNF